MDCYILEFHIWFLTCTSINIMPYKTAQARHGNFSIVLDLNSDIDILEGCKHRGASKPTQKDFVLFLFPRYNPISFKDSVIRIVIVINGITDITIQNLSIVCYGNIRAFRCKHSADGRIFDIAGKPTCKRSLDRNFFKFDIFNCAIKNRRSKSSCWLIITSIVRCRNVFRLFIRNFIIHVRNSQILNRFTG